MSRALVWTIFVWLAAAGPAAGQGAGAATSCLTCHAELEEEMLEPVESWEGDVHAEAGLGCESCHGGDPSPELAEDVEAMSEDRGFRSAPDRLAVADFCARCHSDLDFMRRFNPQARVDQLSEYRESTHGKRNAEGDPVPATCIDCHGTHGIQRASRPTSPVYATNVPGTCASCHADAVKMGPYGHPTDQMALYRESMHGIALLERGDTGAPACNDCHGNHGAAPPGVTSVANVCGQCHGREAKLFRESFKSEIFADMDVPQCSGCHGNHRVLHPTPALFYGEAEPRVSQGKIVSRDPLVAELGRVEAGQSAEVGWTVVLPPHKAADDPGLGHVVLIEAGGERLELPATVLPGDAPSALERPTVSGATVEASLEVESMSGEPVRAGDALYYRLTLRATAAADVRVESRPGKAIQPLEGSVCLTCHSVGDECEVATKRMYEALVALDRELRGAEALLRRAEIAGMEVSGPLFRVKSDGKTAAIESRALIHGFVPDDLIERTAQGREVAAEGLASARDALDELQFRRKGLAVSLVLVALVLGALYLKIREIERGRGIA